MARYAIISDIHGNMHALHAVLSQLGDKAVDGIICLGDVVGYGPYPDKCLDIVANYCDICVKGNHELAVLDPAEARNFNPPARQVIEWTRSRLGPIHLNTINRLRDIEYVDDTVFCVHDSPVPAATDYIHDQFTASVAFRGVDVPICLIGHTHVPMIFEAPTPNVEDEYTPNDITAYLLRDGDPHPLMHGRRFICNPGSIGQPRDCDPRASFAVLDLDAMTFTVHRVEYDIIGAQHAAAEAGLPTVLAARLATGA